MRKLLKRIPKPGASKTASSGSITAGLKPSTLRVFDINYKKLEPSPDNPQEMDDATFDELVEGIRNDGFDEPIMVIPIYGPDGAKTDRFMIISGHHRFKAGRVNAMREFPCIVKPEMDDAARKVALVRRNQLRGSMNKKKFTDLFREVAPILGQETAKRLMGFTKEAAFKKVYEDVARNSPAGVRKQLDEAKETVKSVDDLSSILNGIFRKEGSKVSKGYMVFSYGGKNHHYFQIDKDTESVISQIEKRIEAGTKTASQVFMELLGDKIVPSVEKKKVMKVAKPSKNKA